jgi:hypothetical protein
MSRVVTVAWLTWCWVAVGCGRGSHRNDTIRLEDATARSGIAFVHTDGSSGRRYIVEAMSAGLATFDYDLDGLVDVYFLNGAALPGTTLPKPPSNALYRNLGAWRFADCSSPSGLDDRGFGLGVAVGDCDEDGFPDVFLNNHGPNALMVNMGDGTFMDATASAGVSGGDLVGAGACFVDIDDDGDLDLYVGNYLAFDPAVRHERAVDGIATYPSPRDFPGVPDQLYRNEGDGTFTDVSGQSGIDGQAARAMGCISADVDSDGDADILVVDDVDPNLLWINDGTGRFRESGLASGLAYNAFGDENAGMGVDCADCDGDGVLDFLVTTYRGQLPVLYRGLGGALYEDATATSGVSGGTVSQVKWGCGFVDFDDDGWCDIFIVNGHTDDTAEAIDPDSCYRCENSVLRNFGAGRFVNVTESAGGGLRRRHSGRGAAFDDLDNDGDVDVVVLNSRERPTVLCNDRPAGPAWIDVELRGTRANRSGIGATVRVTSSGRTATRQVHAGRGYQGHFGSRLHFGLGADSRVETLVIDWPGGGTEVYHAVAANRRLLVVQGRGIVPR